MDKLLVIIALLILSQSVKSQDIRQIQIHYNRPIGYIDAKISIKYDSISYKMTAVLSLLSTRAFDNRPELSKTTSEIKISKSDFKNYYSKLLRYGKRKRDSIPNSFFSGVINPDLIKDLPGQSLIEEDNELRIEVSDNKSYFRIDLWHITKEQVVYTKKNQSIYSNYYKLLALIEEIFMQAGIDPDYLYIY